ncbi:helix-turn-helix transcriptional regulator [Pseudomonas aeruginosa]|nr:helix-turn-helix transcriptional regulator [Pseudomonas aeruginosa]MDC3822933.1 helix-turn-helix transcriptional regulator [Pseudomonas aeruginosa]
MEVRDSFGKALRLVRQRRGLTQEDFSLVSSRTFVSMLERGTTSPTLEKLDSLCTVLDIHPVTLLAPPSVRIDVASLVTLS